MCDGQNRVSVLLPGKHALPKCEGFNKFSLLSFSPEVKGLTLRGTEWELDNATLTNRYPLGVSNEIRADRAEFSFEDGALLVLYSKDMSFVTK